MTTAHQHPDTREFELGHFRFHRDERRQLVMIPSSPEMEAYLAFDMDESHFVKVHLLKNVDSEKRKLYREVWESIQQKDDCTICPVILAHGEEEDVPYYVSSLPAGEPVSLFIKRSGPLPTEVAVKIVLRFLRSLKAQNPLSYERFEMAPETLWIARGPLEPRIMFGDFSPNPGPDAEAANTHLCLEMLKFISGNPPFNEAYQELITTLESELSIEFAIEKMEAFLDAHPPQAFWTDFNQPDPLLHQLVPPEVAMQTSLHDRPAAEKSPPDRPLWQYVVGIGAAAALFGILGMIGLLYFSRIDKEPSTAPLAYTPPATPQVDLETPLEAFPEPAPEPDSSEESEDISLRLTQPLPELPPVDTEPAPEPETVVASVEPEPKPEAIETPVDSTPLPIEIPVVPAVQDDELTTLRKAAEDARNDSDWITAIQKEMEILSLEPDSPQTRLRLNDDLVKLRDSGTISLSASELKTIQEAASINPKAQDILVLHYRNTGNWNLEIATLARQGKNGQPAKLSEAGERIFQNPGATEADQKMAREYFVEAAKAGHSGAQFFAGECMIFGKGGDKNYAQGTYYLRQAIDQGDARAMDLLGVCHIRGWGVARDDKRAVDLFQGAIDNGNIPAYYNLGARYAQGQGVERDPDKAAELFTTGSEKGNAHCMLVLARCYEAGYGREQDDAKAKHWFSKAAEKGNPDAIKWCSENNIDYQKHLADSLQEQHTDQL